jgi:lysylphosphatidylglycerol synthetase-like protein (DUF2156 family)
MQRTVVHQFHDRKQIETLKKFNRKYDPEWAPRYVITGPHLHLAQRGRAIALAEARGELPVIGRFLRAKEPARSSEPG